MEILIKKENNIDIKKSLLDLLREQNILLDSICGGEKSKCGKCKIKIKSPYFEVTNEDSLYLSKKEIDDGYRLSCKIFPTEDITIFYEKNNEYNIVSDFFHMDNIKEKSYQKSYGVAIDIGTTTVVMRIYNMINWDLIGEKKILNPQTMFGSDIIARISNSKKYLHVMKELILDSINTLFHEIILSNKISLKEKFIFSISGNTTMIHILNGLSVESIGTFPFTPSTLEYKIDKVNLLIPKLELGKIFIFPSLSGFVGGDIVSGIYYSEIFKREKVSILLDLGTNGEIAIGNKNKIFVTSTAAGPAFEGGNIQCGIGSIDGAISSVKYLNKEFQFSTINGIQPKGICGTGLIDLISIFVKNNFIDDTGLIITEDCNKINIFNDSIFITQKDIREFQLAKSAIRTGLEIAINTFGISKNEIQNLYLSGGFGSKINLKSFFNLGIIPKELEKKVVIAGNTSLAGSIKSMYDNHYNLSINKIKNISTEINLAENENFNYYFTKFMYFEEG